VIDKLKKQLIRHEGLELKPYKDSVGKLTIGVGRNLEDRGVTKEEAMYLLENDIAIVLDAAVRLFPRFSAYPESKRLVIADMLFNLGESSFRGFVEMIEAIKQEDWDRAALEMVNSKWFKQVGNRGIDLFNLMKS